MKNNNNDKKHSIIDSLLNNFILIKNSIEILIVLLAFYYIITEYLKEKLLFHTTISGIALIMTFFFPLLSIIPTRLISIFDFYTPENNPERKLKLNKIYNTISFLTKELCLISLLTLFLSSLKNSNILINIFIILAFMVPIILFIINIFLSFIEEENININPKINIDTINNILNNIRELSVILILALVAILTLFSAIKIITSDNNIILAIFYATWTIVLSTINFFIIKNFIKRKK